MQIPLMPKALSYANQYPAVGEFLLCQQRRNVGGLIAEEEKYFDLPEQLFIWKDFATRNFKKNLIENVLYNLFSQIE